MLAAAGPADADQEGDGARPVASTAAATRGVALTPHDSQGGATTEPAPQHIVPDAATLSGSIDCYACTVEGCGRAFSRVQNLEMHIRGHGDAGIAALPALPTPIDGALPGVPRQYYCPEAGCPCVLRRTCALLRLKHACQC